MVDYVNKIVIKGEYLAGAAFANAKQDQANLTASSAASAKEFGAMGGQIGNSAKQTAAAMRMIPAQMTDIVVSLQSGQAPLTVLLQQGGQLKDMFGGIVPAAKAVGTYVLSLINPYTLAAAAAAAFATASYLGSKEVDVYNKALALTNNMIGTTVSRLQASALSVSQIAGTQALAAETLGKLVTTGQVSYGNLERFATTAIGANRLLGMSVDDVVKNFTELGKDPLKATESLNQGLNYLSLSVYENIKSLEEQGRTLEAAGVAQRAYDQGLSNATAVARDNLGSMERGWIAVKDAIKGAGDALLAFGRQKTPQEVLADLQARRGVQTEGSRALLNRPLMGTAKDTSLDDQIESQAELVRLQNRGAEAAATTARIAKEGIEATKSNAKWTDAALSKQEQINAKLEVYRRNNEKINRARADEGRAPLSAAQVSAEEDAIRKSVNGSAKAALPKEDGIDARLAKLKAQGEQEERQLKQSLDTLKADYEVGLITTQQYLDRQFELKNTGLQGELAIARQQEEIARGKRNVAAVERYSADVKRVNDEILANRQKHANDTIVLSAKVKRAVDEYQASLNASLGTRQQGIDDELQGAGMGAKALEELRRLTEVRREADKQREQLRRDRDKGEANGGISQAQYDAQLQIVSDHYAKRIAQEQDFNAKSAALQGDWTVGAKKALADYNESAVDVASQSQRAFSGLFSGLEDAMVAWATGSKVNIKDVGRAFIAELVRMEVRAAASSIYKSVGGIGGLAGLFGGASGAAVNGSAINTAGVGTYFAAKGAVFNSPSLSAYSNGIYDRPTPFMFAKGAGIFGEAGPEAILPLRRGSDGNLGVLASAGGGAQPSGPAKITLVHQSMRPMQVAEQRVMSDGEIVLMIKEQAAAARNGAVEDVAGGFSDSSHIVSQGFDGSYRAPRTR